MYEGKFPTRLVSLRAKEGVSSRDMSLSIGQNPGYISNIECWKALPSISQEKHLRLLWTQFLWNTMKKGLSGIARKPLSPITMQQKRCHRDEKSRGISTFTKNKAGSFNTHCIKTISLI